MTIILGFYKLNASASDYYPAYTHNGLVCQGKREVGERGRPMYYFVKPYEKPVKQTKEKEKKTYEGTELCARVLQAEAENQPEEGKRLVVDCILNRIDSPEFPGTVEEVCNQTNAFAISNKIPSEEDYWIVEEEMANRTDTEVLYFRTDDYHKFGTPAKQVGSHYFSK